MARVTQLEKARRKHRITGPEPAEAECFDWYGERCPCDGVEPGKCRVHHRARPEQRPPTGDHWKTWLPLCGRAWGKTRTGAEWVRNLAENDPTARIALVGPTSADTRHVMVEGESGILAVSPPWNRPVYQPSIRRLTWPNGAIATTYSAEEPNRLRGPQHTHAWCDELCAWSDPGTWDMLMFGLRLGLRPLVCVTTTPKPSKLIKDLMDDPTTALIRGATHENRTNLAPTFFEKIVARYEGTRLGQQELYAEVLEIAEGAWFAGFDPAKHMTERAEFVYGLPVHLAIDAGTSQTTGAVWFQVHPSGPHTHRVTVFGEYLSMAGFSAANAKAIKDKGESLPCRGQLNTVVIDPASVAKSGLGPAAYGEYERIFGRLLTRAVGGIVVDGLDQMELMLETDNLLIHPRCTAMKAAFQNYARAKRGSEWLNVQADNQSPHEDMMDALRYGIRTRFPEGRPQPSTLRRVHAGSV